MPSDFKQDARQRQFIEQAQKLNEEALQAGHFAPNELVRRMTEESRLEGTSDPQTEGRNTVRVIVAVSVDGTEVPLQLREHVGPETCVRASAFVVPRSIVLLEFDQPGSDSTSAMTSSVAQALRAFPSGRFVELNGPNSLTDELIDALERRPPDDSELLLMYGSTRPSDDDIAIGAAAAGALRELPGERCTVLEAEVFEVLPDLGLAHLTTAGGRMLSVTANTPGIESLASLIEGQRCRCTLNERPGLVVRLEFVED